MNEKKIQLYFGRWNGSISEDLEEAWTRLRGANDLKEMNELLTGMIGIKNRLVSRYETSFLKAAAVLDKVKTSLAELEALAGSDTRLIDLWNAKYEPSKAPSAAIQAIGTYLGRQQAVRFTFTKDGTPNISMEFQKFVHVMIDPSFTIHPKETVGWIHDKVKLEQKRLELQSKDPEHKIRIDTADERVQLVYQGIKYYENESIKLPTWEQITGLTNEVKSAQINDHKPLSYNQIAYYLMCEGRTEMPIQQYQRNIIYDSCIYSTKTIDSRGDLLSREFERLKDRHDYNRTELKSLLNRIKTVEKMTILSPKGMAFLIEDKRKILKLINDKS